MTRSNRPNNCSRRLIALALNSAQNMISCAMRLEVELGKTALSAAWPAQLEMEIPQAVPLCRSRAPIAWRLPVSLAAGSGQEQVSGAADFPGGSYPCWPGGWYADVASLACASIWPSWS